MLDIESKDVGRAMQGACMQGCKEYSVSLRTGILHSLLFLTALILKNGQVAQVVQLYRNGCWRKNAMRASVVSQKMTCLFFILITQSHIAGISY